MLSTETTAVRKFHNRKSATDIKMLKCFLDAVICYVDVVMLQIQHLKWNDVNGWSAIGGSAIRTSK